MLEHAVVDPGPTADPEVFVGISGLLNDLANEEARAAEIVRLKVFAGCSIPHIAQLLEISERTAHRDFEYAGARAVGRIEGTVWVIDGFSTYRAVGATVSAIKDGRVVATSRTDGRGQYTLLAPSYGDYSVRATLGRFQGTLHYCASFRPGGTGYARGCNLNIK